ncbi:MAG: Sec-independent protein translocase protein TatB [Geminicoccaceae bacterium]
MFDLGWSEMGIVMLIALLVLGPKELPKLARDVGRWVGKARALAREFRRSLEDMANETELGEVKKQIDKAGRMNVGRSIESAIDPDGDLKGALRPDIKAKNGKDDAAEDESRAAPTAANGAAEPGGATAQQAPEHAKPAESSKPAEPV